MEAVCRDEAGFGPAASCRAMDFSLGFQYRILAILPAAVFLFLGITRTTDLWRRHSITKSALDALVCVKLTLYAVLLASLAATLGLLPRDGWAEWATTAFGLELAATVVLAPLSYLHHTRRPAPSTLITCYLLLTALFSATQLRTYANTSLKHLQFFPAFAVAFGARACLVFVELTHKRRFLRASHKPAAHEPTASLPARLFFVWLYPVLISGFRRTFTLDDLNAFGLPENLSSAPANRRLREMLAVDKGKDGRHHIFGPSIRAFAPEFLAPVTPKLLLVAATFAQPYLVKRMLSFIDSYSDDNVHQDAAQGWALVGAYAIVYPSIAFLTGLYWDRVYTMVVTYRAALVSVIMDKSMLLSATVAESEGRSAAVTYMSVDVERVCEGIAFFHETWSAVVSIVVAAVVLWFQASFAMIPPICIMAGFCFVTSWVGKRVAKAQKNWMGSTQARIKVLTSVMSQIIPIKLLAVEPAVPKWVEPVRNKEIAFLRSFFKQLVIVGVLSSATINLAGVSALGTYVGIKDEQLRPEHLFTILTVVNLATLPISTVGNCFPLLLASFASMKRIEGFLSMEERPASDGLHQTADLKLLNEDLDDGEMTARSSITAVPRQLQLSHVTVEGNTGGKAILSDVCANIYPNSLNMIAGPVGSGKTTLLRTLLGETKIVTGTGTLPTGRIAYAPQEAFVWPTTVRENIVLDNLFDAEWYETVIDACALRPDLARMDKGDMTVMADAGGSVSGGQRQRISLARAVYARCRVTLLDDCFSALDAHTSNAVFDALFGSKGLLRGGIVVLATHSHRHLGVADHVIVLDAGSVVAEGTLAELHAHHVDLRKYVGEQKDEEEQDIADDDESAATAAGTPTTPAPGPMKTGMQAPTKPKDAENDKKEAPSVSSWAPYRFYLHACGYPRLLLCLACLILYTGMQVGLQILLRFWSESGSRNHGPWLGGYAAFTVACFLASFVTMYTYTQHTAPHASLAIHARQLDAVLGAPVTYFQRTPAGMLQNRWSSDMFVADFAFPRAIQDFTFTAVYVIGAVVLILIAVPWLAIAVPFIGLFYWSLQRVYLATSRQLQRLTMSSKTPMYTAFTSSLNGLVTIRAFQAERLFKTACAHHLDRAQAPMYYRYAGIRFLRTALNLLTALIAIAIAALAVGLRGSTSGGFLGVALSQLVSLAQSLINLLLAYTRVENGVVSVERVFELDSLRKDYDPEKDAKVDPGPSWPSAGQIEYRGVSLRYAEDSPYVLDDLTFTVRSGQKLGICGRTGSGKSSTVFALLRGLDQEDLVQGQILIDGVDISTVPVKRLREAISTVSQTPFLLYASLRDNLLLGCAEGIDDQQIWSALDLVGMKAAVENLDGKLDTLISADGLQFSGGERQLLCIARVLLQKRRIVVLDEATSSMDMATDKKLLEVLQTALRDTTVISVAHRISTIIDYDTVMVMADGRIVEIGVPQELLRMPGSRFEALHRDQQ